MAINVFVTSNRHEADYKVFFTTNKFEAKAAQIIKGGKLTSNRHVADAKVFITNNKHEADIVMLQADFPKAK
ncbi:MAG: hypothetical protein J6M05_03070 [Cardiobacteriaceae bacterium]|nr:hypothetical protein [Cardiobacteriaceae bacterium]